MYNASKRLQAIRRQLLHMDEQYRNGIEDSDVNANSASPGNCLPDPVELVRKGCESPQAFPGVNFMLSPATDVNANSMDLTNVLGTIAECPSSVEVDDIPLSEELRSAISNMEDLDDVDNLIGNVISAVQVDESYDKDLETVEHVVTLPEDSIDGLTSFSRTSSLSSENSQGSLDSSSKIFMSAEEEESWRKDRRKKDNHNIIERRRRYNINDRIKELATLLPPAVPTDLKQNKGSILKASVEYIKELKKDKEKLHKLEDGQRVMDSKYQKLLFRIFQLELKLKLYGLTEDLDDFRVKKKKPKRRLSEINAVVEGLCKEHVNSSVQQTKGKTPPSGKKNRVTVGTSLEQKNTNVKHGLRQHLCKKMAAGNKESFIGGSEVYRHLENQMTNEVQDRDSELFSQFSGVPPKKKILQSSTSINHGGMIKDEADAQEREEVIELSTEQCNILLDLFENHGNVNEILINSDIMPQPEESPASQECLSPVTSTSNMLEKLLRGKGGNSDSSGLEDSTESTTGLR